MPYFNEIIVGEDFALNYLCLARGIFKIHTPISVENLRKSTATVLQYRSFTGRTAYLLKSHFIIVAMVNVHGDGVDFLRLAYGWDARVAYDIRNFFADYCREDANIYIYKP